MSSTNHNRRVLLLIAGIPLMMILSASWLWYFVVRGDLDLVGALGTANMGTLVQPPRPFAELEGQDASGQPFSYGDVERRWTLLVPQSGARCDQHCEERLYLTRQIHIAMGKELARIRRMYVGDVSPVATDLAVSRLSDDNPLPPSFSEFLETQHPGLASMQVGADDFARMFPEYLADPQVWYLVDPAGWVMMSYNGQLSYKDVISDLKFLLKNSSE